MDRNGTTNTHGTALGILEGEDLTKGADIQPGFAGFLGIDIPVLLALHHEGGPLAETAEAIVTAILGLDEDLVAQVLHPVAELALDAHIAHLAEAVVVGPGAVTVQRVTVGVGPIHGN